MAATGVTRGSAQRTATAPQRSDAPKKKPGLAVVSKRKIKAQARRHRTRMMLFLVAGVFAVALFFIGVGQNLLGTQQMRLDNLQQELNVATQKNANLLLTRAQLSAPAHILQLAQHNLGMVTPLSVVYLKPVATGRTVEQTGKEPSVVTN